MHIQSPGKCTTLVSFVALLLAAGLLLSACVVQVPVDVNATAQAIAHSWATQTAEAQPGTAEVLPVVSATNTEVPTASPTGATAVPQPSDTATPTQPLTSTSTVTQPPPLTATFTPTAAPRHTATPTVTPKPTNTNTPTPSPFPPCSVPMDAALAPGWNHAKLGCPNAPAKIVWSAWQPFQHGDMIWMEDTDWVYALNHGGGTDSAQGDWATGGQSWRWDNITNRPDLTPPEGLVEPVRGFGFVWYYKLGGPSSQIGWGTGEEKGFCALVQGFEKGMLIQSTTVPGCAGGQFNWAATADFSPVFVALYADNSWRRF
jgi:hypothetical protein